MCAMHNYHCMLHNSLAYLYYKENTKATNKLSPKTNLDNFHPRQPNANK